MLLWVFMSPSQAHGVVIDHLAYEAMNRLTHNCVHLTGFALIRELPRCIFSRPRPSRASASAKPSS
jgi:hypothetical protein